MKRNLIIAAAIAALFFLFGFLTGKKVYDKPIEGKIERDTVTVHDTVPDLAPSPKDSVRIKWVTRWLPVKPDTVSRTEYIFLDNSANSANFSATDSVAVEVPITQKHYGDETYDAWVSGYEPNLDSIFVYQKTQLVTERVTVSKPPNRVSLDVRAGVDYTTKSEWWRPYAVGELTLNNDKRFAVGVRGGVERNAANGEWEPAAGFFARIKVF